jgi:glycosyltransferase involved in cell wall biosynthesis
MAFKVLQINSARKYIGEAAHTLNLTVALRRREHEVHLVLRRGWLTYQKAAGNGLSPIGLRLPHRWWPPDDLHDMRLLAETVRKNGVQLIHAHRGKDHWLSLLAIRFYRLRIPLIRTRHVVTPLSGNPANRFLARRTARLIAVSTAVYDDVNRTGIYRPETVALIPGGTDLEKYRPPTSEERMAARQELGLAQEDLAAFCVARMAIVKAHRILLPAWKKAAARIPRRTILFLIGDGPLLSEVRNLAEKLQLLESVGFLGFRDDVPKLLSAADLGVLSSVGSERFLRAVLEYMACGLPTVATRVGAVPDLIDEGKEGLLVQPHSEDALATALSKMLNATSEQRTAWGVTARLRAQTRHSFEAWASAHEKLYDAVIKAHAAKLRRT